MKDAAAMRLQQQLLMSRAFVEADDGAGELELIQIPLSLGFVDDVGEKIYDMGNF